MAVAAAALVMRIARPGLAWRPWGLALAIAPLVLGAAVIGELLLLPESQFRPAYCNYLQLLIAGRERKNRRSEREILREKQRERERERERESQVI